MRNVNITNFRQNLFEYVKSAIEYNDVVNINTKNGNAVIMSEEEYNGLIETFYLTKDPKFVKDMKKSLKEDIKTMPNANEVEW